jgi:hypothetical protein
MRYAYCVALFQMQFPNDRIKAENIATDVDEQKCRAKTIEETRPVTQTGFEEEVAERSSRKVGRREYRYCL